MSNNPVDESKQPNNTDPESDCSESFSIDSKILNPENNVTLNDTNHNVLNSEQRCEKYRALIITRATAKESKKESARVNPSASKDIPQSTLRPLTQLPQLKRTDSLREWLTSTKQRTDTIPFSKTASSIPTVVSKDQKKPTPSQWTTRMGGSQESNRASELRMTILRRPPDAEPSTSTGHSHAKRHTSKSLLTTVFSKKRTPTEAVKDQKVQQTPKQ